MKRLSFLRGALLGGLLLTTACKGKAPATPGESIDAEIAALEAYLDKAPSVS